MSTVVLKINVPDTIFTSLRKNPEEFTTELRLAAAVKWYELGEVSQEKAAEIAGLSRERFVLSLERFRVSPFQYSPDEVAAELRDAE